MLPSIIAGAVIIFAVGGALLYVIKAKKNGKKCIGCPYCDSCKRDGGCASSRDI